MIYKFLFSAVLLLFFYSPVNAQDLSSDSISEETDVQENFFVDEKDLMDDYNNKNNLKEGSSLARTLSYDDSLIVSRLSRIPTTIEMPLNNVTRKFIDTYSTRMKGSVSVMLGAGNFYMPIFEEALERYGLPLELKYLPVIESALRPSATSRVGAAGLWQFMITTGNRYGLEINTLVDERRDPVKSSDAAARYLRDLYAMFGNWNLAIAAYNCGEGNVQRALLRNGSQEGADFWDIYNRLPRETRGYVPAFIAATYIMNYYCEHGIVPHEATLPQESDTVMVRSDISLDNAAQICGMSSEEIRAINPQFRHGIVPQGYAMRLPLVAIEAFINNEDSLYSGTAVTTRRAVMEDIDESANPRSGRNRRTGGGGSSSKTVTVKSGDNLGAIARRNHTTVANLRRLNGIKGDRIRAGQKLRVK